MDPVVYVGVAGLVIAVVEVIKGFLEPRISAQMLPKVLPLIVLVLSMGIYSGIAVMLDPAFVLVEALKAGFVLGILASGIYGMGKAIIEQMPPVEQP